MERLATFAAVLFDELVRSGFGFARATSFAHPGLGHALGSLFGGFLPALDSAAQKTGKPALLVPANSHASSFGAFSGHFFFSFVSEPLC
jgi:hypothetical protein